MISIERVLSVDDHPNADKLWIASIRERRIIFSGKRKLTPGELVPVLWPGERFPTTKKKVRARNYRGVRSEGVLLSLVELGWTSDGPDEVHVIG